MDKESNKWYVLYYGYSFTSGQVGVGLRPTCTWFLKIAFVQEVGTYVCVPKAINYIHMILNMYNKVQGKFYYFSKYLVTKCVMTETKLRNKAILAL